MPVHVNHNRLPVVLHLLPPAPPRCLPTPMISAVSWLLHLHGDAPWSRLSYSSVYTSFSLVQPSNPCFWGKPIWNTQVSQIQRLPSALQGYVHISVKNHLRKPIQLDISATWEMQLIHISDLMALSQQRVLPQAKESSSSQPVEESVQKTGATFQPRLMKIKNRSLGCWQLFLPLAVGPQKW